MLPKQSIITPEMVKQREQRHRRLMKMIKNFKRTNEQIKNLQKIKNNTVMQINLRYIRSDHNRHYKFPKIISQSSSDNQIDHKQQHNPFTLKKDIVYDLRTQNQLKNYQQKHNSSNEHTYRVKSLQRQKNDISQQRIGRLKELKQRELSYKKLRKNSMIQKKRVFSTIKLPQLKRQNIKTQTKTGNQSMQLNKIIGKKLITQINSPAKNMGMSKYLKKEDQKRQRKKYKKDKLNI